MSTTAMRILVVGEISLHTSAVLARLAQKGFGCHEVRTLEEAIELLGTFHFDVVLALENLPDGRGYDLGGRVGEESGSLLVSVMLSETCLWLPVLDRGAKVLGDRALNVATLELDLEEILSSEARDHSHAVARRKAVQAAGSAEIRPAAPSPGTSLQAIGARHTKDKISSQRSFQNDPRRIKSKDLAGAESAERSGLRFQCNKASAAARPGAGKERNYETRRLDSRRQEPTEPHGSHPAPGASRMPAAGRPR